MGPTASGKTDLAIKVAQHFPCDIISVDSAMVYRGMDIGSAKPSAAELQQAPHRLINICDPATSYSGADFCLDAKQEIEQILACGRFPLLVGGTMLYFYLLQQGITELPQADPEIREKLQQEINSHGLQACYAKLQKIDPTAASRIHAKDSQRIQRALEIYYATDKTMTELLTTLPRPKLPYQFCNIALLPTERALLHEKISLRFENMLQLGFIDEVARLYQRPDLHADLPAMRAVGYRQAWQYLDGLLSYAEMQEKAVTATRQLAKRQITWLKSWQNLIALNCFDGAKQAKVFEILRRYE